MNVPTGPLVDQGAFDALCALPLDALEEQLHASGGGLSSSDAADRLARVGPNELSEHRRSILLTFLGYYWAPIPWMIEVALVLSAVARHWADAIIIGVLLVMNGVVAFWEEHQAANAVAALQSRLARTVTVRRDGVWRQVLARELVPGDVVHVHIGDVIPADGRVLGDDTVELDQSALTGESLPVSAGGGGVAYSGSVLAAAKPISSCSRPARAVSTVAPPRSSRRRERRAISSKPCCGSATT